MNESSALINTVCTSNKTEVVFPEMLAELSGMTPPVTFSHIMIQITKFSVSMNNSIPLEACYNSTSTVILTWKMHVLGAKKHIIYQ